MISDEMRELVSAYVDGELRDADAARVEDWSKRDPQLRREIQSLRLLSKKLREWDEAEHGGEPSDGVRERALERARNYVRVHMTGGRMARVLRLFQEPWAVAAALLVAVAGAALLAWQAPRDATVVRVADRPAAADAPSAPWPELPAASPAVGDGLTLSVPDWKGDPVADVLDRHLRRNEPMSDRARELRETWARQEEQLVRLKQRPAETRTGTWNLGVQALVGGYETLAAPMQAMVLLGHPAVPDVPVTEAMPLGERWILDKDTDPSRVNIEARGRRPLVAIAGEVLSGTKDGSGRLRIVTASSWIRRSEFTTIAWGDRQEIASRTAYNLQPTGVVLGPRARREILAAEGKDEHLIEWIEKAYAGRALADALRRDAKGRERVVARLVAALDEDPSSTGFAVVADGEVMGVELFASHALMLSCAPRLLRGYVFEAGEKSLVLDAPTAGAADLVARAKKLLDDVPERAGQIEDVRVAGRGNEWPDGMKCVHLKTPTGQLVGHGLVLHDRPLHLSLFP